MGQGYTRVWALISLYTFCDRSRVWIVLFFFHSWFFSFFPYTFCDRSRVWIVRADVRTPTATFSTVSEWEEYEGGADGQL